MELLQIRNKINFTLNGKSLGVLTRDNKFTFEYTRSWLSKGFDICPSMPLAEKKFTQDTLFPIFYDVSPDTWGQKILLYAEKLGAMFSRRGSWGLSDLEIIDRSDNLTRQGAIETNYKDTDVSLPKTQEDVHRLLAIIDRIEQHISIDNCANEILKLLKFGLSSGGSRPKFNLFLKDNVWLCKCKSREDTFTVPAWEAMNLELAKLCGITVPDFHYDREDRVLYVKRFDRIGKQKIHYISAWTMCNSKAISYTDIAKCCQNDADKKEVFKRMFLNACIGNYNDHAKNHGFLYYDDSWHLSPVFDLKTLPFDKNSAFHSIGLANGKNYSALHHILSNTKYFALTVGEAKQIVLDIHSTVKNNLVELTNKYGISDELPLTKHEYKAMDKDVSAM